MWKVWERNRGGESLLTQAGIVSAIGGACEPCSWSHEGVGSQNSRRSGKRTPYRGEECQELGVKLLRVLPECQEQLLP